MKGQTLDEISAMVDQIGREFKSKQAQVNVYSLKKNE